MKENIFKYKHSLFLIATALTAAAFTGCRQEDLYENKYSGYSGEPLLELRASVFEGMETATRELTQTPVNVEPSEFDGFFYVEVNDPTYNKNPEDPDSQPVNASKFGYYRVPLGGNGGVLEYAGEDQEQKPNWFTIDDNHFFWSWTLPWTEAAALNGIKIETWGEDLDDTDDYVINRVITRDGEEDGDGEGENGDGGEGEEGDEGDEPDPTPPLAEKINPAQYLNTKPIRIKLQNTKWDEFHYVNTEEEKDSSWNYGSWGNGYFFEKFIGAKSGPYDFRRNGMEVPLQFRHLMSKISVRSLLFYRADGSKDEELMANITFFNMPDEFTFYPHPTVDGTIGQDNEYMKKDGPPIVVTNQSSAKPNSGITFGYTHPIDLLPEEDPDNKVQFKDKFYICPEVDFSKVSFMLEVSDPSRMTRGEYYGDFASVAFDRSTSSDYDNIEDEDHNKIDDTKVLHAGETMYFDLIVREYGGGGYTIYVRNWSTRPLQQTKHYPHPGIYVDGEAIELIGTSQTSAQKFELYGDGFLDGENEPAEPKNPGHLGVYHVYNDIEMGNRNTFPVDKDYVVNGMGHILHFSYSNADATNLTIGKMIDVYLEMNGYSVYIDPEGFIYTINPTTGKYEPNGQQLDLESEKGSFSLNLATGTIS